MRKPPFGWGLAGVCLGLVVMGCGQQPPAVEEGRLSVQQAPRVRPSLPPVEVGDDAGVPLSNSTCTEIFNICLTGGGSLDNCYRLYRRCRTTKPRAGTPAPRIQQEVRTPPTRPSLPPTDVSPPAELSTETCMAIYLRCRNSGATKLACNRLYLQCRRIPKEPVATIR